MSLLLNTKERVIIHHSRIITYVDEKKKLIPLFTNKMDSILMKKGAVCSWNVYELATMARIIIMYYVDFMAYNHPEKIGKHALKKH